MSYAAVAHVINMKLIIYSCATDNEILRGLLLFCLFIEDVVQLDK